MVKRKLVLNESQKKELEGFEDSLDLINAEESKSRSKGYQQEDHKIYDYLEKEKLRLEKIDNLFSVTIPLDRNFSQTEKLIAIEEEKIGLLREDLIQEIQKEDSIFLNFLQKIYEKAYSD